MDEVTNENKEFLMKNTMTDENSSDETVEVCGNESANNRNVFSFGIPINTSEISTIAIEDQGSELKLLDVDVYEQDEFEREIVNQVDTALSHAESNFKQNIIKKQIEEIRCEIRNAENERKDIEKVFLAAKDGDSSAGKKISFSLLQQKQHKDNLVKRLEGKLKEAEEKLVSEKKIEDVKDCEPIDNLSESIKRGEITPFEALEKQKKEIQVPKLKGDESFDKRNLEKNNLNTIYGNIVSVDQSKYDDKFCEKQTKRKGASSDEEYVPSKFDNSTDDDCISDTGGKHPLNANDQKKGMKRKPKSKYFEKAKRRKVKDDGNFDSFKERMRQLKVREKLKNACKAGEVMEEFNPSDFSEDEDSQTDVTVQDNFILPNKIWSKLYRYQHACVRWLWQLHIQEVGGIVGDEMGLGKTIQVIAFLIGLSYSKKSNGMDTRKLGLGPVLIVCPATVMHHWVKEFHKWWPKFRVGILHESGTFTGRKATLIKAINNHPGVLVTSYAGVRLNKDDLYKHFWQYVILDEGHKIRNPDSDVTLACKQFDTPHRLILSGTPMQNNLKELWSLFDFVFPGRLGTLPVFMTEFAVPITMGGYANASSVQVQTAYRCATILKETINPYMLRRMKKDVKTVIGLPAKNEQVLFCKLTEEQKKLYKAYISSSDVAMMMSGQMKIFVGLMKLRKICNHPDLVFLASEKPSKNNKKNLSYVKPSLAEFEGGYGCWKRSGKMIVIENLLRIWSQQGHRVLLFSQSKQMLNILESFVKSHGYKYLRMDGTTAIGGRQTLVKKYNEDKSIVLFLLTTRVGGLGLNLIGADRIVIYDPDWNPSTDSQARERCWRIGQDKEVTIYRLITTGTIEEKIYHRQIFKQFLTNRVLTNPFQRRFFKSNDLYELFTLGDVGPSQSTETGALFAGTGSEIKLRKKAKMKHNKNEIFKVGKSLDTSKKEAHNRITEKKSDEDKNTFAPTLEMANCSEDELNFRKLEEDFTCNNKNSIGESRSRELNDVRVSGKTSIKESELNEESLAGEASRKESELRPSKGNKKRKKKKVKIDGTVVNNVVKSEIYKKQKSEKEDNVKSDGDDVLMSLFRSSGIHSALKHDRIEHADNSDFMFVEKEAERVANEAVNKLRQSRAACRSNGLSMPTWTGNNTSSGKHEPKKRRFGKKLETATIVDSNKMKKERPENTSDSNKAHIDVSSSALLARMKSRNSGLINTTPSQTDVSETPPQHTLLRDIQQFFSQRIDRCATSDEVTTFFQKRITTSDNVLFKEMLKQVCSFERNGDIGIWKLKEEFL